MARELTLTAVIIFLVCYILLYCFTGKIKVSTLDTFSIVALGVTALYFVYQIWLR